MLLADQDRGLLGPRPDRRRPGASSGSCLRRNQPGPYQIQAAINAVHSDAPTAAATDWRQILQLYDQLLALAPSPVVALNRAVAVAEVEGPDAALALVDGLDLDGYHLFHAIRADLLRRLGRNAEAALAYEAAIARTENAAERASCGAASWACPPHSAKTHSGSSGAEPRGLATVNPDGSPQTSDLGGQGRGRTTHLNLSRTPQGQERPARAAGQPHGVRPERSAAVHRGTRHGHCPTRREEARRFTGRGV